MLTAIMDLVFNCFQISFLISKKQCLSLSKKQKFQKRSTRKIHSLQNKTECQKYKVSVTAFAKSIPANFLVLTSAKLINQNLSKANYEIF